jgi:hypothetical protein
VSLVVLIFAVSISLPTDFPRLTLFFAETALFILSFKNIHYAIENVKRSGARWLLTTTFPGIDENRDVDDGDWRALNFQCAPFFFPEPAAIIIEGCTEAGGDYSDKSLALWSVDNLPIGQ